MLGQTPTFEEQATRLLPSPSESEKPRGIRGWFRRFWEWLSGEEDTSSSEHRSKVIIDVRESEKKGFFDRFSISDTEAEKLEREHAVAARRHAAEAKQRAAEIGIQADGKPIHLSDLSLDETVSGNAAGADQKKQTRPENFSLRTWPLGFAREQKANDAPAMKSQEPGDGGDGSVVAPEPVIVVVEPVDANVAETVAAASPEAPQTQGEHKETPDPANENPAPVAVEKKKGKGFFKGAFLSAAAQGAAKYGMREGMTQLGWLGGPGGVFATAAGSSVVVTGFAIGADYRAAKKKILEDMKKNNAESVWSHQARREVLRTIFNKEGRRKYGATAAKSFVGGLFGGGAVAGLADFVESNEDAASYLKNKFSFFKDKLDSVKDAVVAKYEALKGAAPAKEPTLKERLVGRDTGSTPPPPATINTIANTIAPPAPVPAAAPAAPPLPLGGDDGPLPAAAVVADGKEPLIMPVLENFESFADDGGLAPSTVEKIAEARHGDPKAIWTLADNFANGTGGVEQDNGMAEIFCREADRLLEKDSICPEGDLAKEHGALFDKQLEQWDAENAASDARFEEMSKKIQEIQSENDRNFTELKMHIMGMNEVAQDMNNTVQRMEEILAPEEISDLHETEEAHSEAGEECAVTDNADGTYEVMCRSRDLSVGDEFVAEIK